MDKIKEKLHIGSSKNKNENDVNTSTGHVGTIEGK
jgi:hypothetical protein